MSRQFLTLMNALRSCCQTTCSLRTGQHRAQTSASRHTSYRTWLTAVGIVIFHVEPTCPLLIAPNHVDYPCYLMTAETHVMHRVCTNVALCLQATTSQPSLGVHAFPQSSRTLIIHSSRAFAIHGRTAHLQYTDVSRISMLFRPIACYLYTHCSCSQYGYCHYPKQTTSTGAWTRWDFIGCVIIITSDTM